MNSASQPDTPSEREKHLTPIRVCFLIDRLIMGGTERQLLELIVHLDRRKVLPHLCILDGNDSPLTHLLPQDCKTLKLKVSSLLRPRTISSAFRFWRFLRMHRIQILQTIFPDSTYFGIPIGKAAGCYCIRTRRDLFYWVTPMQKRFGPWIDGWYNRLLVDAMVTNCECAAAVARRDERPPVRRIATIPNGIQLKRFLASTSPKWERPFRIGVLSMLRPEKRLDLVLRAASLLKRKGWQFTFEIAGDGPLRDDLKQMAKELDVSNEVVFHGQIPDAATFFENIHIFVQCSDTEALSNSIIEAMAAAKPVVVTAVGGNNELIRDQFSGILIPPNDPCALSESLIGLFEKDEFAKQLGRNGRSFVETNFSMEKMVQAYFELWKSI